MDGVSQGVDSKGQLRILVVISFPDAPQVTWNLTKELTLLGHHVELVVPAKGRLSQQAASLGIPCHLINIRSSLVTKSFTRKRIIDARAVLALRSLMKTGKFDIVHLNLLRARVLGRLAALFPGHPPIVSTVHGPDMENPFYMLMERVTNWIDEYTIAVSSDTREHLAEKGIPRQKLRVIHNGVDLNAIDSIPPNSEVCPKMFHLHGRRLVGLIAYLYPGVKGHEVFLKAARHVLDAGVDATFLLVGGPPYPQVDWYEKWLKDYASELNIQSHVRFLGDRQDVIQIIDSLDVVVLPSVVREGFGMVLVEAMARKKTVVASRIGGIVDVVEDNVNGLLVPPGDSERLADAILRVLSDGVMAREFGVNGRRRVEKCFSSRAMALKYECLFAQLIRGDGVYSCPIQ